MKKIAFETFGCKLNFAETSAIARTFPKSEYQIVDFKEEADIYVINTCSVTGNAEKKCKQAANRAKRLNPNAKVSMIGCFSQIKPQVVAAFKEVDLVLGNEDKFNLYNYIEHPESERSTEVHNIEILKSKNFMPAYSSNDRTRSFLKIQDGCDYFCTYCSIPQARGLSRSDTIANTIKVAEEIGRTEAREIILSGVNIGDFGRRNNETFYDFLVELEKVRGIDRIRISSVEPELLNEKIIDLVANSTKFQPHFHIPLQSGSDKILKDMRRKYDVSLYASRVEYIKKRLPNACIAADVIIGFPTETEVEFMETYNFLRDIEVSYMHVFTYSQRENTVANKMAVQVSNREKMDRSERLHKLSDRKKSLFYTQNFGTVQQVLFESQNTNGMMSGWTGNYIKVSTPFNQSLVNQIVEIKLDRQDEGGFLY